MKDRYMIGEVAELLNMSPQSLRFYDKAGVVVPAYTDPKTGYRYYSYDQIHYIDRVKYLQRFGFKLEDIRDALAANDVSQFRKLLVQRQDTIRKEVSHLQGLLDELDWYVDYYGHVDDHDYTDMMSRSHLIIIIGLAYNPVLYERVTAACKNRAAPGAAMTGKGHNGTPVQPQPCLRSE